MTKNINFVSHKKSKVKLENGKPQLPSANSLVEGEIAVNYAENVETLSIKNESGTVVTFSSDGYFKKQYLAWEAGTASGSTKLVDNGGTASGKFSVSEGQGTIASGNYSHAEGNHTLASGASSHAEGLSTSALTANSHAEGNNTLANNSSHAEGYGTIASGYTSHAEGMSTEAKNASEHASGRYNVSSSASTIFGDSGNTLFSVGNGTATARHNAFEIRQNGDIYIVNKAGQDVKLQDEFIDANNYYTKSETSGKTELSTAFNLKANVSDLNAYFDDAKYEDSGTTKVINFYNGSTIKATIDASDFIKDGMIDSVTLEAKSGTTYLVITWNTDAGKTKTELNIGDIFEADNYYNKAAIDTLVGSGFTSSSITDVIIENEEIISAALTDLDDRKLDASAYTPTDLSNYYQKSETSGKTEIATALSGKANTATTIAGYGITDAYTKSETSGKTEIATALSGKSDTGHTHVANAVTAMTGYAIATSASSISTTDTLIQAIGKLEKRIALLEAALIVQNNGDVYGSGGDYES